MLKLIYNLIEGNDEKKITSKVVEWFLICLIVLNMISVIVSSFNDLPIYLTNILNIFEIISVTIFTIEYLLRLITAGYKFKNSKIPFLKYIFSFMSIIDLLAILPFYLPLIIPFDLRFLRMLRLFRLFRIFKLNRYNNATQIISNVLKNEKEKLFTTIFVMSILIIFSSSIMYYVENDAQPDKFPNIVA